ncbi:hypothetical protein N7491_005824 [Penicillium cf. griseofulvum]|uniref:Uncharacterized protein n=1 Tax=Penicillium cf. griseofulvum TaxID=2972120 RepID=A0A9W9J2M9_9EURO|nr:hypothetical protein N7472_008508 [Penicillium cf. griseofulvum]KAJ5435229.1 hypothetical protein N7491_005824 [Penicillium cf. griseofulvum]KAJ5453062.1 hypothetical protein N7445_001245 [Penicillium cf. griseofulvum]
MGYHNLITIVRKAKPSDIRRRDSSRSQRQATLAAFHQTYPGDWDSSKEVWYIFIGSCKTAGWIMNSVPGTNIHFLVIYQANPEVGGFWTVWEALTDGWVFKARSTISAPKAILTAGKHSST